MSASSWRLETKNLCLTYPQCETSLEVALQSVEEFFGDRMRFAVVSQENHADEQGVHLHMAIALKDRFRTRDPASLDVLAGKHGNYQSTRSMIRWVKYVIKDGSFVTKGIDVKEYLSAADSKQSTQLTLAATMLQEGETIETVDDQMPGLVLQHLRKLNEYASFQKKRRTRTEGLFPGSLTFLEGTPSTYNGTIATWLQANLLATRAFKDPQLYVYGPPNAGKTSLINKLEDSGIRIYRMPYDTKWYDSYEDGLYDLIVLDEFKGQKKIQDLNLWLEGGTMPVCRRGMAPYLKKQNLPMMILSNFPPEAAYKNCSNERLAPFLARLKVLEIPLLPDVFIDISLEDTDTLIDSSQ